MAETTTTHFFQRWIKSCFSLMRHMDDCFQHRGAIALALFAVVYYALYFNANLTLTGEAGSNVLIAQRINEGWRPIKDMFIGYNLMWFYPLSWIFEFTGPHLLASRIYFMILCLLSGLLGFHLVRRTTQCATLAVIAGGLMILMPGAMYRNNVGFVAILGSFALVHGYVISHRSTILRILWMGFCGAALSVCYLIRIEPSLLLTVVWIGLVFLYPLGIRGALLPRLKVVTLGTMLGIIAFAVVHAPFVVHAHQRGFGREFLSQYSQFFGLFQWELKKEIQKAREAVHLEFAYPEGSETLKAGLSFPVATVTLASQDSESAGRDGRRGRPDLNELIKWKGWTFFTLSIYFPVLASAILAFSGGLLFSFGITRNHERGRFFGLLLLTTTGAALSLFPQYFFFRPDSVHLAEFMVPFYPALACAAFAGWWIFQNFRSHAARVIGLVLPVLCAFQVIVAFNALYGREGSGSIRLARGRTAMFHAPGGIDFRVKPAELRDWEGLRDALLRHSMPGDYLITFPYVPILNIMAQRPSYQFKLYVDNATESENFSKNAIADFEKNKPALVVISNRDINKTEISRFKNWAAPFYQHIANRYVLEGIYFGRIEVFVRPDRWNPDKARP